ncbi:DUF4139 domain-containing protein [Algoriphagus aquimarinus]|uniref:Mucoidy inhibitor MuiA family protein n=1 Tax=Algoriphagus aquimarinus TaxID=237018 RepID=A0A1I0VSZ1_9BACT|nr:DUF4139 domain-containing protein [Algoriphagus aquimarinus]SFA78816.1 conserved hypothetical protein [Algoriphagus aquimarinus]|tara:strand:+ start:218379 stop:220262 length:1884 start_codon:yes stop_codon:yes gene_type:complete
MKKFSFSLILSLFAFTAFSQEIKETPFKSEIKEVTVFLSGAQVFETAKGQLAAGESLVLIKGLSPYLDEKSIQVKGLGNFTIQAVNRRMDYLTEVEVSEKVKNLEDQIKTIQSNQNRENRRMEVLKEKNELLNANKKLGGAQAGPTVAELKQAIEFYDSELMKIKNEELEITENMQKEMLEIAKLRNQINAMRESGNKSTSEIRIRVKTASAGSASFELNYLVANAGWYPKYDVRVKNVSSPLSLNYKAEVFQNTGVDWKNVKLRFSNGDPNQSGQIPELDKWELNYARLTSYTPKAQNFTAVSGKIIDAETGEAIPGASILVKGTTIGTASDFDGNYSLTLPANASSLLVSFIGYTPREVYINSPVLNVRMNVDIMELNEVVSVGNSLQGKVAGMDISNKERRLNSPQMSVEVASGIATSVIENQTTVEIEVAEPYSIKSNGEKTLVDLKAYDIPALYQYSAVPKLDNDAFLIAQVTDWSQYSLLQGESNLYFEDGFVGKSILDAAALQDTLNISMGRDRSIVIQREKNEEYSKKRSIGNNITETRGYEITVRNNKSQPITISVEDQIPVSVNSDISVETVQLSGGKLDPQTGKITWLLTIPAGQQQVIPLQYEVKYPKKEKVILD